MKRLLPAILLVFVFLPAAAQNWLGLSTGNMAGTNGLYLNPASIVDNRLSVDIHLAGAGINAYNNYISFSGPKSLFRYLTDTTLVINNDNIRERLNGKDKVVNISADFRGPGFMVSLHPKHAIAITTRSRTFVQAVDVSQPIARMIRWGLDSSTGAFDGPDGLSYEQLYSETRFGININSFAEAGISYATVLMDKEKHFLKAGITYKYLAGMYSFYFKNDGGGSVEINGEDSLTFDNTNMSYGYVSEGFYRTDSNNFNTDFGDIFGANRIGKGFGLDLGVTYEFRPKYKEYRYELDGKERWNREADKYFLRVSATVMDIGRIRYNNQQYVRNNVLAKNKSVTWGEIDTVQQIFNGFDSLGPGESVLTRFDQAIGTVFGFESQTNELTAKLPTAFNLQADVRVAKNVYVNLLWLQGLRKKGAIGMRQFSMLGLTPRFDTRQFGVAIPMVLNNDYRNFALGAMLRLGPLYIGSDNLSGLLKSKNVYGFDFYAGLHIPLYKNNPRDRDKDGVSDRRDRCRKIPGKWEFNGCPDRDGDGVEDSKDACPDTVGLPKFNGCPDRDGDGVEDSKDECIDVPGEVSFNGCPDTDDDGVEDRKDSCKFLKGLPEMNGCPDRDGDGVEDRVDDCPDVPGPAEFTGCPDTDGDGVRDISDKCPDKAGKVEYKGCPDTDLDSIPDNLDKCPIVPGLREFGGCPDTDGDGVPDHKDLCPLQPGLPENNGCPAVAEQIEIVELDEEEEKVLREAFDNLEFETGKSIIQAESYASLDELVALMKAKPEYRLYIAGHTDNVGNKKSNQKLSENRANAVKAYLVSKGIDASRIKTEGFGDARPVADNKTPEGRQKNRRVEFKVIK